MADDDVKKDGEAPPKIKLNVKPSEPTEPTEAPPVETPAEPPKKAMKITAANVLPPAAPKAPEPPAAEAADVSDLPKEKIPRGIQVSDPKADTSMIDLAQAEEPSKTETSQLESQGMEVPKGIVVSDPKKDTSMLDVDATEEAPKPDVLKGARNKTVRVDLDDTVEETAPDAAKNATMRVALEEEDEETAAPQSAAKKKTMRVSLEDIQAETQPSKRGTMKVDLSADEQETVAEAPTMAGGDAPRTIKIKRPGAGGGEPGVEEAVALGDTSQLSKGSTAKIDLPDRVETESEPERKTIRIKRPTAESSTITGGKTLKISRPTGGSAAPQRISEEAAAMKDGVQPTQDRPSAVYSIAALFAVIIVGVLLYVMMAQMPWGGGWDWPGKLVYYSHIRF